MALRFYGVEPLVKSSQLEDELFDWIAAKGFDYHDHAALEMAANFWGHKRCIDRFVSNGTIEMAKKHLLGGNPVVTAGYFTDFGHIVLLRGYDESGFFVNDSYGEYFADGYRHLGQGENLHYSYDLIRRTCEVDGFLWLHLFEKVK
jgi:hypothetical protein